MLDFLINHCGVPGQLVAMLIVMCFAQLLLRLGI